MIIGPIFLTAIHIVLNQSHEIWKLFCPPRIVHINAISINIILYLAFWLSVATAIAGVFANFTNKIGEITWKLEDVDKTKSQGVSCQH